MSVLHGFVDPADAPHLPELTQGHGVWVNDRAGKKYLNVFSGLSLLFGLGDEGVEAAILRQLKTLPYAHASRSGTPCAAHAAEALLSLFPAEAAMEKVLFSVTGSEAVESAVKLARWYQRRKGRARRKTIVTLGRSYHGNSLTCMALSDVYRHKAETLFGPLVGDDAAYVCWSPIAADLLSATNHAGEPPGSPPIDEQLEQAKDSVAAVLVEPISGAGGVFSRGPEFFRRLERKCRELDILLVVDEAASGLCRTGPLLAATHHPISGDLTILSKAMNGGYLPAAALICSRSVARTLAAAGESVLHGASQSANPACLASVPEVVQRLCNGGFTRRVPEAGAVLTQAMAQLQNRDVVRSFRCFGLLAQLELRPELGGLSGLNKACLDAGLIAYVRDNRIGIFPPLTITDRELAQLASSLDDALSTIER